MSQQAETSVSDSNLTLPATTLKGKKRQKALPAHARAVNRALVLQTLFHEGEQSRADLSRATGLTRVTISDVISDLIDEGLVHETGTVASTGPGKPGRLVDIDRQGHAVIGVDLSSPGRFRGALMNLDGTLDAYREVSFESDSTGDEATEAVTELVSSLLELVEGVTLLGVGVGSPGLVDDDGVVVSAPNLGWQQHPLASLLSERLDVPVTVVNDANAAVLAERTYGGAEGDTFLVRIGQGVGGALLTGGTIHTGQSFTAGEIGHVVVGTDGGAACACGNHGCLEVWVGERYLRPKWEAANDDEGRQSVITDAAVRLGIALAPVVATLDLGEIIVSGRDYLVSEHFRKMLHDTVRTRTLPGAADKLTVRANNSDDIVITGAAVTVLSNELGVA